MNPSSIHANESAAHGSSGPLPLKYLQRYGLAILSVGVALGAGLLLQNFHFRVPSALLLFAVAISSWYGGLGPAVLAAVLSSISCYYYFLEPVRTPYIYWSEIPYFIIFVAFAALVSWFGVVRRRVEADLHERADLLDLTHDTVFTMDLDGIINYWNRGAAERYGWSAEQAVGRVVHDLLKTVFPAPIEQIKAEVMRAGRWEGELLHTKKDATQVVVASRWSLQRNEGGAPVSILETNSDITERKRAEEDLRRTENELRSVIETIPAYVFSAAPDSTVTFRNSRWREYSGLTLEPSASSWQSAVHPEDLPLHRSRWEESFATGKPLDSEARWRRAADGEYRWLLARAVPLRDEQGNILKWYGILTDIEDRKQAEEALRRSNRELRAISNCNQVLLRATDEQRLLQEICRIVCEEAGYRTAWVGFAEHEEAKTVRPVAWNGTEEAVIAKLGVTWAETERGGGPGATAIRTGKTGCINDYITDPQVAPWREIALQHGFRSAIAMPLKDEYANPFGTLIIYCDRPNAFSSEEIRLLEELAGDLAFGIVTLRSRAARKQAEESLRYSEMRFRTFVDHATDAFFMFDEQSKIVDVNRQACESLGYTREELIGLGPQAFDPDADEALLRRIHERLDAWAVFTFDARHRRKDGTVFPVEVRVRPFSQSGQRLHLALARDITERKRAEEEVRNTAAQWQATFDAVQDMVLLLDKDFRILRANHAAAEFLGLPFDKIVGGHCYDLIHGTSTPPAGCPLAKVRQSRRREEVEVPARKGGPWWLVSVDPVFDPSGELTQFVHVARDITERKRAEEALRQSEAYLAESQRLSHTGSWGWNAATGEYDYWSEETLRIYGFDPQEGLANKEDVFQRIHPEDRDRWKKNFEKSLREKADTSDEYRIVLPDGTVKHIHAIRHPVLNGAGDLVKFVGTSIDITERKRAEEALREYREHLEELVKQRTEELVVLNQLVYGSLEAADVGAWWIDFEETDTCHALDNTARMLGWEPDPTGGKTYKLHDWEKLLADTAAAFPKYGSDIEESHERFAGAISGKYNNYRAVYPLAAADGSLKWIDGRAEVAKRDEYGHALLMTGTFIDVTKSKQVEADFAEAKARAEAASRAKGTFLANMSHELRTPLNAVLGFSRLLKSGPDVTPQQQEALDIIVRSGEHLLNLINNVLDMAKIESGRVVLEESEVDLHRLLHELQSLMGVGAAEKGLSFALECAPDLPRFVAVDAGKLRQVLINLIGNAVKYTDSGRVKLRAKFTNGERSERAQVRFEVEDSGPGISQEDCERIFFPFVQLGELIPAQAGTGLGLAICKQYVELMGGQIGVASELGKGSVFYFDIPLRILSSVGERDELKHGRVLGLAEGERRYRLLIVEDQPENRLLLRRLLDPLGFELREAVNGQEAVALFEQWHPDLIWMDIRMPVMDGLEAVRRIRATKAGANTKIIALTAHALEEESGPIMAAGCDDLVRKPFLEQELFDALARHLRLKFIYEKAPRQESTQEPPVLTLRREQLDALPVQLLQDLRQAVIELDTARTHALIKQVTERDASLGQALSDLAKRLDYKRLLRSLEKE
jgi:PAS domain S-box-containing protein